MAFESRSRMVSFRLTLEEYERFRELCYSQGLRNVSEMVRAAVNHMLANTAPPERAVRGFESRLTDVEARLNDLTEVVERLHHSSEGAYHQTAGAK